MSAVVDEDTVWFRVSRVAGRSDAATNEAWMISRRTPATLGAARPAGWWGGDYPTKDAAIAHGEAQGWIHVLSWAQAKEQAKPLRAAQQERAARARCAREGLVQVRIGGTDRWVTPAIKDSLLLLLRTDDPDGVVRRLRGGIVL